MLLYIEVGPRFLVEKTMRRDRTFFYTLQLQTRNRELNSDTHLSIGKSIIKKANADNKMRRH